MILSILVGLLCAIITVLAKGLTFPLTDAIQPILVVGFLLALGYARPYFRLMLWGLAYLVAFSTVYAVLMDSVTVGYTDLFDDLMLRADAWLGFDVRNLNQGGPLFVLAYYSFMPQFGYAVWKGDLLFLRRFTFCAFLAVAMLALMPVRGNYTGEHGLGFISSHFDHLQTATVVTWQNSQGILTFPSIHAAAAVLKLVHFWRAWWMVPLNFAMLISCVPVGRHYVVDILAGAVIALMSLAIYETAAHSD